MHDSNSRHTRQSTENRLTAEVSIYSGTKLKRCASLPAQQHPRNAYAKDTPNLKTQRESSVESLGKPDMLCVCMWDYGVIEKKITSLISSWFCSFVFFNNVRNLTYRIFLLSLVVMQCLLLLFFVFCLFIWLNLYPIAWE